MICCSISKPAANLAVVQRVLVRFPRVAPRLVQVRKARERRRVRAPVAREQQRVGRRGQRNVRGRGRDLDQVAAVRRRPALRLRKHDVST